MAAKLIRRCPTSDRIANVGRHGDLNPSSSNKSHEQLCCVLDDCTEPLAPQFGSNDNDISVYASLLRRCATLRTFTRGKEVHALLISGGYICDTFLANLLIQMYGSCGALAEAESIFWTIPLRNVYSWNLLIGAYVQNDQATHVFPLFQHMQQENVMPDQVTFVSALSACSGRLGLVAGQWMHVHMQCCGFERDSIAGTALLNMYGKCDSVQDAIRVFDQILERNIVSWNAMFAVFTQHDREQEAIQLFLSMEMVATMPNKVSFITLLPACTCQGDLAQGKRMHARILDEEFESDVKLENALLDMYGKCGALEIARSVFDSMAELDVISWNAMAEAYIRHENNEAALNIFKQMQEEGILPDEVSCITSLSACVNEAGLAEGKRLHCRLSCGMSVADVIAGTALVNMYAKCGDLGGAEQTFNRMQRRNVVSWNAMIAAYAQHGQSDHCIYVFQQMLSNGFLATDSTYFSILSACSHAGLLREGFHWFEFMVCCHCIEPTTEHFNCMIDIFGRSGQLDYGEALLYCMSCLPNAASWATLLASCKVHSDVDRGVRIIQHVIRTDPESAAPYVSISNMYAAVGRWNEAEKIQQRRKDLRKQCEKATDYDFMDEDFIFMHQTFD